RQGHVELLAGEPGLERGGGQALLRFIQRRLDFVLERVELGAACFALLGLERAQALQEPGQPAVAAERSHPDLLERVETRRRLDELQQLVADMVETLHYPSSLRMTPRA